MPRTGKPPRVVSSDNPYPSDLAHLRQKNNDKTAEDRRTATEQMYAATPQRLETDKTGIKRHITNHQQKICNLKSAFNLIITEIPATSKENAHYITTLLNFYAYHADTWQVARRKQEGEKYFIWIQHAHLIQILAQIATDHILLIPPANMTTREIDEHVFSYEKKEISVEERAAYLANDPARAANDVGMLRNFFALPNAGILNPNDEGLMTIDCKDLSTNVRHNYISALNRLSHLCNESKIAQTHDGNIQVNIFDFFTIKQHVLSIPAIEPGTEKMNPVGYAKAVHDASPNKKTKDAHNMRKILNGDKCVIKIDTKNVVLDFGANATKRAIDTLTILNHWAYLLVAADEHHKKIVYAKRHNSIITISRAHYDLLKDKFDRDDLTANTASTKNLMIHNQNNPTVELLTYIDIDNDGMYFSGDNLLFQDCPSIINEQGQSDNNSSVLKLS